jgi:hypothetical protein
VAKLILYEKSLYDEAIDFNKIGRGIKKAKDTVKKAYNDRKDRRAVKKAIKKDKKDLKKKTGAWSQFKAGLKGRSVFDDMSEADLVKHAIHLKKGDKKAVAAYLASNINKYKADKNSKLASKFEKAKSQFDKAKDDEKHPMNKYAAHVGGKKITNKDVKRVTDLDGDEGKRSDSEDSKDDHEGSYTDDWSNEDKEHFDNLTAEMKGSDTAKFKGKHYSRNKKGVIRGFKDEGDADDWADSDEKKPKSKDDKKPKKKDDEEDDISWRDALSKSKFLGSAIGPSKKGKKPKYDDLRSNDVEDHDTADLKGFQKKVSKLKHGTGDTVEDKDKNGKIAYISIDKKGQVKQFSSKEEAAAYSKGEKFSPSNKDADREKAKDAIKNLAPGEQAKYRGKFYSRNQSGVLKKFDNEIDSDKHSESDNKGKSLKDTPDKLKNLRMYSDLKEVPKDKKDLPDNFKYKNKYFSRNKDGEIKAFEKKEAADHWAKSNSRDENKPEKKDLKKASSNQPHLKLLKNKPTNEDIKNFKMEM